MVNAIHILSIGLGSAFLLGLFKDSQRQLAYAVLIVALAAMAWIAVDGMHFVIGQYFSQATQHSGQALTTIHIFTAGAKPPFAINLQFGLAEGVLVSLITVTCLLSAIYMRQALVQLGHKIMSVLLVLAMALSGIVMTRDLFNLFVFFELVVIASSGLILLSQSGKAFAAGFKYLIVAQLVSIFLLVGIIFAYHAAGSLNIDDLARANLFALKGGAVAFFLVMAAMLIETKPFPANGWALDIYETSEPGFSAIFSAAIGGAAAVYAIDKLMLMASPQWFTALSVIGLITFIAANIMALSQQHDRRLLGYSSVGQVGLLLVIMGQKAALADHYWFVIGGVLSSHAVAKAGLYWLSGLIAKRELSAWASLRQHPWLVLAFITFIGMLSGLPPFPGFYAKWQLITTLMGVEQAWLVGLILFAVLLEASYLFRWFGYVIKREAAPDCAISPQWNQFAVIFIALALGWLLGWQWGELSTYQNVLLSVPLLFALAFIALEKFPVWFKNTLAIAGMVAMFVTHYQSYDPLQLIFAAIVLLGGAVILLASYHVKGARIGFYSAAMLMYAGLINLVHATNTFAFFAAWEFLTIGSYFLILRGKNSEPHALSYVVFSLGGALCMLAGFTLAAQGQNEFTFAQLGEVSAQYSPYVFALLAIAFMTKTASLGVHIWLPGAHSEAETDVSPMVSGILLKAGLFGLVLLLMHMGKQQLYGVELTHVMMWIGAGSALIGNLLAVFQEDAKRLLAYSSIGQMGYAVFGLAMMNHLGWLMALMFIINHYIYKSMLFLAVGGVAKRTGTRDMYKMGGLIKLMPLSFISVLIGIIAVSGVPPLSGFGGRWIFYNAIMDVDYRLPVILVFMAGPIAFLYLFRLIQTIFLGQLKDELRAVKEAPFWIILPQMIFVIMLLAFAAVPGMVLRRVDGYLKTWFDGGLNWGESLTITSDYGYWSPVAILIVVGVVFVSLFLWLLFVNRKAQMVKQFNIVFAAERPYRPETTHFAWNFFAPYRKALGVLTQPFVTRFWQGISDILHGSGAIMRRIYSGDGQTYGIHMLLFLVIIYLLVVGG